LAIIQLFHNFVTMSKKLLVIISLFAPIIAFSQYRWDFGTNVGGTGYLGEIGGDEKKGRHYSPADLKLVKTRFVVGGFARYKLKQFISIKGNLNYIRITGDDALSANYGRRGRNLNFTNGIIDAEVIGQVFFLQINNVGGSYKYKNDLRFYAFAGLSGFYSNPTTVYQGTKIALRPLKTEGVSYSPFNFGIPGGVGAYFTFQRFIRIGIEAYYVKTFTDYLDDVSTTYADPSALADPVTIALANRSAEYTSDPAYLAQYVPGSKRGDASQKDTYLYTAITGSYVLKGKSAFYRAKYGHRFGGKKFKKRRVRAKF
jgi:hypothetical protein